VYHFWQTNPLCRCMGTVRRMAVSSLVRDGTARCFKDAEKILIDLQLLSPMRTLRGG